MEQIPTLDLSEMVDDHSEKQQKTTEASQSNEVQLGHESDFNSRSPWLSEFSHLIAAGKEANKARKVSTEEKWEMAMQIYPPLRHLAESMAVMNKKHLNALGRGVVRARNIQEINEFCTRLRGEVASEFAPNRQVFEILNACLEQGAEKTLAFKKLYALVKPEAEQGNEYAINCLKKIVG